MPVDFEPLYSASPPLFKPFAHMFSEYRYAPGSTFATTASTTGITTASTGNRVSFKQMPFAYPLRPILIVRPDCNGLDNHHHHQQQQQQQNGVSSADVDLDQEYESTSSPTSPVGDGPRGASSRKKRVVFADDRGMALEHIKVMTEPSDCPPRWQDDFFEHVTKGATATVACDRWEPVFAQPASDYVEFRRKLERDCVCLENVITKETDESVVGTVKVKNLSFDKQVLVRVSFDRWNSHVDHECVYVPSGTEGTSLYDLYDTFSFSFSIPHGAAKFGCVEFCVCYRSDGREFWDNNGGVNYKLQATAVTAKPGTLAHPLKFDDAFTARINTWTEFASWNHLVNDTPYW